MSAPITGGSGGESLVKSRTHSATVKMAAITKTVLASA
jgi:hypothetical protein